MADDIAKEMIDREAAYDTKEAVLDLEHWSKEKYANGVFTVDMLKTIDLLKRKEALIDRQREEIGRLKEALDRYRYATQWTAADAWDFCSDCQERIRWAHENDPARLSVNEVAAVGKVFLATALSDTTREGLGAATPQTASYRRCSGAGEDGNE